MKQSLCIPALYFAAAFPLLVHAQEKEDFEISLQPFAHIGSAQITEMSGIVKSPRRDNLYWVHNDSGDTARIFAITADGNSVLPTYSKFTYYGDAMEKGKQQWQGFDVLYADNVDWEDIAADANYLYVADTGNNDNERRDLALYLISEIDPTASTRSAVVKKLPIAYPEQTEFPPDAMHFDSESLFVADGKPYLITKHRGGGFLGMGWEAGANLYRLDTSFADRTNLLTRVDSHPELTAATSADLSPDGRTLAVLSYEYLYLFHDPVDDLWLSTGAMRRFALDKSEFRQAEAITWESADSLLITNEQGDIFRVALSTLPGGWGG